MPYSSLRDFIARLEAEGLQSEINRGRTENRLLAGKQLAVVLEELFAGRNLDVPRMQAEMSERMAEEGLEYGTRTRTYNSRLAQELGCWADGQQGGGRLHDDLFRAYFVDDVNLAVVDHLV